MDRHYTGISKPEELVLRQQGHSFTQPYPVSLLKKDLESTQAEIDEMDDQELAALTHLPQLSETFDKSRNQQSYLSEQFHQATSQLHKIFATLRNESAEYPDCLPTSFVRVEKVLAQCISECLGDVPEQNRSVSRIQSLLRDYKVVQLLPDGKNSISLHTVHVILQDNYKGSYFCQLLDIVLAGFMNSETKVIYF